MISLISRYLTSYRKPSELVESEISINTDIGMNRFLKSVLHHCILSEMLSNNFIELPKNQSKSSGEPISTAMDV